MDNQQEEHIETILDSPIPLLQKLRLLIFGEIKPDPYTQVTFYITFISWLIFFLWSLISYFAISFKAVIQEQKSIDVAAILKKRGEDLGFEPTDFLDRLLTFHLISIVCWLFVFVGIVLIWRKDKRFIYFFFGGTIFYLGMLLFYLNFAYYKADTTFFDKLLFIAMNLISLMYFFLLRKEENGGSLSFFGEDEEDEG